MAAHLWIAITIPVGLISVFLLARVNQSAGQAGPWFRCLERPRCRTRGSDSYYLATQLREEGRLAALAGHRARAIESYRQYLGLRTNPEPGMVAEVEPVRDELRKLEQTDSR